MRRTINLIEHLVHVRAYYIIQYSDTTLPSCWRRDNLSAIMRITESFRAHFALFTLALVPLGFLSRLNEEHGALLQFPDPCLGIVLLESHTGDTSAVLALANPHVNSTVNKESVNDIIPDFAMTIGISADVKLYQGASAYVEWCAHRSDCRHPNYQTQI